MKIKKAAIVIAFMISAINLFGCGKDNSTTKDVNEIIEEQAAESLESDIEDMEIIIDEPRVISTEESERIAEESRKFAEVLKNRKKEEDTEIIIDEPNMGNSNPKDYESDNSEAAGKNNTSTVADDTNTFAGTINGKNVIGYLDSTYTYRVSGDTDYNATFITLDENGAPEYEIYIRMYKDVSTGTYSNSGQYDKDKIFLTVYTVFDEASQKFGGSYTFLDSNKSWTINLTNAEYSDNGVFKGTIEGTSIV